MYDLPPRQGNVCLWGWDAALNVKLFPANYNRQWTQGL